MEKIEAVNFKFLILLQNLNPNRSKYAAPYDSTQGVGKGFYWFAITALFFLALIILKAFWDDKEWRTNFIKRIKK
ncbi:hypothetical protein WSM22_14010 [Cytophagales bacterium WSM2-2]|nr:hypothetical protein WSM22_14010 [Cytophagales bacterium WSM2-2]